MKPILKNYQKYCCLYCLLIILFVRQLCQAQYSPWKSFSTADGLGDVRVNKIFEANSGDLWFGTRHGATRYNGYWENFTETNGLVNNKVHAIGEDNHGKIWIGTEQGISIFNDTTFIDGPEEVADDTIWCITDNNENGLWLGTTNGAYLFDMNNYTRAKLHYTTENGLKSNAVSAILKDRKGNIWFGTSDHGIAKLSANGNWEYYTNPADNIYTIDIRDIFEDYQGNIWFAAHGSSVIKHDGNTSWVEIGDGIIYKYVTAITQDWDNNIWISTEKYVFCYDGKTNIDTITTDDGLIHREVLDVLNDSNGNLWFATGKAGISRYDGSWRSFLTDKGEVRVIERDHSGNLWIGFTSGGLYRYDQQTMNFKSFSHILDNPNVRAIEVCHDSSIWVGIAYGRVTHITASDTVYYSKTRDKLTHNNIWTIYEDRQHNVWFGTHYGGVIQHNPVNNNWKTYKTENCSLCDNTVRAIYQEPDGSMWFGTWYGISRLDSTGWTNYNTSVDFHTSDDIRAIVADSSDTLWFGTMNGGVIKRVDSTWQVISTEDGLVSDEIMAMAYEHRKDRMWFCTTDGISRKSGDKWQTFTQASHGLSHDHVTSLCLNEVYETTEQGIDTKLQFWFGTGEGVSRYLGESIPPNTFILSPKTVYSVASPYFYVNAKDNISLSEDISYSYKISELKTSIEQGLNYDWSDFEYTNVLSIKEQLNNGRYEIQIRAKDGDNNIDQTPARHVFQIDIDPPGIAIISPRNDSYVTGKIAIIGMVTDTDLEDFYLQYCKDDKSNKWNKENGILQRKMRLNHDLSRPDTLAIWYTGKLPQQIARYKLQLVATDTLGHESRTEITVNIDPTSITENIGQRGGYITTRDEIVSLYIPPKALPGNFYKIRIMTDTTNYSNNKEVFACYQVLAIDDNEKEIHPQPEFAAKKQGTISINLNLIDDILSGNKSLRIKHIPDGSAISRLCGTVQEKSNTLIAPFTSFGKFQIVDTLCTKLQYSKHELTCRPRIFSAVNNGRGGQTAIQFTLTGATRVTIKIYNTAGRLVRTLKSNENLPAGDNAIAWDGHGDHNKPCQSGLYIICLLFNGNKQIKTVAIINK